MAKRVMDRRALRAEAEAAERLEAEAGGEAPAAGDAAVAEPKKKKAPAKPRKPRATKAPARMRVVWTVFNNSNHPVAKYDYPKKDEAEAHAKRLAEEKRIPHFVIPVKEPMEVKEEV